MKYRKSMIAIAASVVMFTLMLCLYSLKLRNDSVAAFGPNESNYCVEYAEETSDHCSDCENGNQDEKDSSQNNLAPTPEKDENMLPRIGKRRPDRRIPRKPIDGDSAQN